MFKDESIGGAGRLWLDHNHYLLLGIWNGESKLIYIANSPLFGEPAVAAVCVPGRTLLWESLGMGDNCWRFRTVQGQPSKRLREEEEEAHASRFLLKALSD